MGKPKIHNQGVSNKEYRNAQIGFWFDRRGDGGHTAPERSAPEKLTPGPAGGRLGTAEGDRRHCRWHARMTAQQYLSIRSAGHIDRIDEAVLVDRIDEAVLVDRIDEAVLVDVHGLEEQCSCTDEAVLPEDDSWVWARAETTAAPTGSRRADTSRRAALRTSTGSIKERST